MRIGIDLDGVLANFVEAEHDIAETVTRRLLPPYPVDWDATNWFANKDEESRVWAIIRQTPNFWMTLARTPGANPSDLIALDQKATLYYVTTRVPTAGETVERQSAAWLHGRFGIMYPTVIVTKHKGAVAAALGLDAFIDDKPENLLDVVSHSPSTRIALCDASYNRSNKWASMPRVKDFEEFAALYVHSTN